MITITQYWYQKKLHPFLLPLLPFSWLFRAISYFRRLLYRFNCLTTYQFPVPVIIVGNISVGGTGKTPFVIWLVRKLQEKGFNPGIVSRGMGSQQLKGLHWVNANDKPEKVGDEALLIKQATAAPFVIGHHRANAVTELLKKATCDIIVSDDGLQHYRLARTIEIAMVDGERLFGNKQLLPAGPLREPLKRLNEVDFVIYNSLHDLTNSYVMKMEPISIVSLQNRVLTYTSSDFPSPTVHAVAGIGNPERFFSSLKKAGFTVIPHVFPDHYLYSIHDFAFADNLPIIMTEKDAVKCSAFADERFWCQHIETNVSPIFEQHFFQKLSAMETQKNEMVN